MMILKILFFACLSTMSMAKLLINNIDVLQSYNEMIPPNGKLVIGALLGYMTSRIVVSTMYKAFKIIFYSMIM